MNSTGQAGERAGRRALPNEQPDGQVRSDSRVQRAQCDIGVLTATLERVATLHTELATAYRELAVEIGDIQLADRAEPSLMCDVPTPGPELMTVEDLGAKLRVSAKTVRRWRNEGRLPGALEIAGVLRWRRVDFEKWLEERGS